MGGREERVVLKKVDAFASLDVVSFYYIQSIRFGTAR